MPPATSPLYQRVAAALSASTEAVRAIGSMPARQRRPAVLLAALHDLALAGRAPALAAAYAAGDADAAADAAVDTLVGMTAAVSAVARRPRPDETGHQTVLYPAIAEAARRVGADRIGLIDVGCSAGLNLTVDRVGISYGRSYVGDAAATVQLDCRTVGDWPVPERAVPAVVARIGIDPDPLDVSTVDGARWLRTSLPPDRPERRARLDAELALAASAPPQLLRGDFVDLLPEAIARVPADALPVVTSTWALSRRPPEARMRFLQRLDAATTDRAVAWVPVEGVGVAPAIPTMGDRPASGHSIVGVAVIEHASLRAEAVGRCWLRGSMLAWLTGTSAGRRTNISTATKTPVSASVPNAPSAEDAVTRATTSASPRSTRIRTSTGSAVTLMDTPRNSAKAE